MGKVYAGYMVSGNRPENKAYNSTNKFAEKYKKFMFLGLTQVFVIATLRSAVASQ